MTITAPFDDIRSLLRTLPGPNDEAGTKVAEAFASPAFGGVGKLQAMAAWLATWSDRAAPRVDKPMIAIFAGAHGVVRHGVTTETDAATKALIESLSAGQGAIARLCAEGNIGLKVLDLALDLPTADFSQEAALSERDCAATMAFGMEAVAGGHDVICLAGIGAGDRLSAKALLSALYGVSSDAEPADLEHLRLRETTALTAALALHGSYASDPLEILRRLGGRETAAIAGAIVAARMERVPIVLDGLSALAAAAVLQKAEAGSVSHCRIASSFSLPIARQVAEAVELAEPFRGEFVAMPGIAAALAIGDLRAAATASTA